MKQTVLITGASSGIGLEFAKLFAQKGNDLVIVGKNKQNLTGAAQQLKQFNVKIVPLVCDLTRPAEAENLFNQVNVPIDILVNNAGFGLGGALVKQDIGEITDMMELNMVALTQACRLFGSLMVKRKSGKILNVASVAGFFPGPLMAVYYATKAYVVSFSESLAEELKGTGVSVTCLCPGPTETGFQKRANMERSKLFGMHEMSAKDVARIGYEGLRQEKLIVVPGFINRFQVFFSRFVPRSWEARVIKKLHQE